MIVRRIDMLNIIKDIEAYNLHKNSIDNKEEKERALKDMESFYIDKNIGELKLSEQFAVLCCFWNKLCCGNEEQIEFFKSMSIQDIKDLSDQYKMQPYGWGDYKLLRHDIIKKASQVYSGRSKIDKYYHVNYNESLRKIKSSYSADSNKYIDRSYYSRIMREDAKDAAIEIKVIEGKSEDTTKGMRKYLKDHKWNKHTSVVTDVLKDYIKDKDFNSEFGGASEHQIKNILETYFDDKGLEKISVYNQYAVMYGFLSILSLVQNMGSVSLKDTSYEELKYNDMVYDLYVKCKLPTIVRNNEENKKVPAEWEEFEDIRRMILTSAMDMYNYGNTSLSKDELNKDVCRLNELQNIMTNIKDPYISNRWLINNINKEMTEVTVEINVINDIDADEISPAMERVINGLEG